MSSWIPSFPFSYSVPWSASSRSVGLASDDPRSASTSPPPAPPSARPDRRFPSLPSRGAAPVQPHEQGSPSGNKRARSSFHAGDEPGRKKARAGIVGTVLGKALDAAVFSTAMGYSAYQLWKHPPTKDDVDALVQQKQLMLADAPHSSSSHPRDAPPPYSEMSSSPSFEPTASTSSSTPALLVPPTPSQIPRRVRHVHERRPRPDQRSATFATSLSHPSSFGSPNSTFDFDSSSIPLLSPTRDPLADLSPGPIPHFEPYSSPRAHAWSHSADQRDTTRLNDEEDFEEDDEMRAVSERLKTLIETGRDALASRPREWSDSTTDSTRASARSRMSTSTSQGSAATTVAASPPRKPSPLTQFTARFEPRPTGSTPSRSSPRHSLPNPTVDDTDSAGHSRRRSLDNLSRGPVSASMSPAFRATSSRKHRHTHSQGGVSSQESLEPSDGRGEAGVAHEFERVLQRARSRSSLCAQ